MVARRLVPTDELGALIARLVELGESVSALEVSEHFDVSEAVAQRALELRATDGRPPRWAA